MQLILLGLDQNTKRLVWNHFLDRNWDTATCSVASHWRWEGVKSFSLYSACGEGLCGSGVPAEKVLRARCCSKEKRQTPSPSRWPQVSSHQNIPSCLHCLVLWFKLIKEKGDGIKEKGDGQLNRAFELCKSLANFPLPGLPLTSFVKT